MQPSEQIRPGSSAIEAAVSLLADADPRVVATCRRQVLQWGAAAVPVLQRAAGCGDPVLRARACALLSTLRQRLWLEDFDRYTCAMRAHSGADGVLEKGIVLLSSLGRGIEPSAFAVCRRLDELADELRSRLSGRSAASAARTIGACLGDQEGFGGRASHYDLDGVAIDVVLDRRRGLPVTLAIVYLLIARRAGIRAHAVAMPDHFLVRVHGARPVLIDPMQGGAVLTKADCIRYLRSLDRGTPTRQLEDVDDRVLLQGVMQALRRVFGWREDAESLRVLGEADDLLAAR